MAPSTQTGSSDAAATQASDNTLVTDKHKDAAGRPVLVYFFWPADKSEKNDFLDKRGEATDKFDKTIFGSGNSGEMEKVARVANNFCTIKVNAKTADAALMKRFAVTSVPCFRATTPEGKVVWSFNDSKVSAAKFAKELETCLKTQFPEYYKGLDAKLKETQKVFEEGKAAMKKDDFATAVAKFQAVCDAVPRSALIDQAVSNIDIIKAKQKKAAEEAKKDAKK